MKSFLNIISWLTILMVCCQEVSSIANNNGLEEHSIKEPNDNIDKIDKVNAALNVFLKDLIGLTAEISAYEQYLENYNYELNIIKERFNTLRKELTENNGILRQNKQSNEVSPYTNYHPRQKKSQDYFVQTRDKNSRMARSRCYFNPVTC
uniref:Secreted protein n=1 Tax=Rhabditophanes sp. KR3021 TaxID=114890 RepID=A0AC35U680_9BILA